MALQYTPPPTAHTMATIHTLHRDTITALLATAANEGRGTGLGFETDPSTLYATSKLLLSLCGHGVRKWKHLGREFLGGATDEHAGPLTASSSIASTAS